MAGNDGVSTADEYQDLLLRSPGFTEFLLGLSTIAASRLGADGSVVECTITVERDGAPTTFEASSAEGRRLDETQYAFHTGPCLTALQQQRTILVDNLRSDPRWGPYLDAIAEYDVHSMLAVPIQTDPSARAALNCYAHTTSAFDPAAVKLVEEHAASMSGILRLALRLHPPEVFPDGLQSALRSRAVMDAAISLIMAQTRGGRDDALELLQAAAASSNRRMQEIAAEIVDRGSFPGSPNGDTQ